MAEGGAGRLEKSVKRKMCQHSGWSLIKLEQDSVSGGPNGPGPSTAWPITKRLIKLEGTSCTLGPAGGKVFEDMSR